jgi:hypothetical protein
MIRQRTPRGLLKRWPLKPTAPSLGSSSAGSLSGPVRTPSLTWQGGAGWGGGYGAVGLPDFLKSLANLLLFFEITAPSTSVGGGWQVYSLNGVSTSSAISVYNENPFPCFALYVTALAGPCWYYLLNWFAYNPPASVGPVCSATYLKEIGALYVAVSNVGGYPIGDGMTASASLNFTNLTLVG